MPRTVTVAEAADLTSLTQKAIRRRIEKGQLRAVRGRDGLMRLAVTDLEAADLVRGASQGQAPPGLPGGGIDVVRELVATVERQANELAQLRMLTREAESLADDRRRLEEQLFEARAETEQLRQQLTRRRRWLFLRAA